MVKIIKGKYISFSAEELKTATMVNGLYRIEIPRAKDSIEGEDEEILMTMIRAGKPKGAIYKEMGITEYVFNEYSRKRFDTIKIVEIRDKVREQDIRAKIEKERKEANGSSL